LNWSPYSSSGGNEFAVASPQQGQTPQAVSAPKLLTLTRSSSGVNDRLYYNSTLPAQVEVSADIYANTLQPTHVIARGSGLDTASPTYYAASIISGTTVKLLKVVSGNTTVLTQLTSSAYTANLWVRTTISVSGSSLKAQVVRLDNAQYLNSSGQWQTGQAWALTWTDTDITGPGQVGLGSPPQYQQTVSFDDFSAVVLPENFDGPAINGLPPGWAQGSNITGVSTFAVSPSQSLSAPNSLASTSTLSGVSGWAYNDTLQPADVQVSAAVNLNTLLPAQVFARGTGLTTTAPTYYAATVTGRGLGLEIEKVVAGDRISLAGPVISSSYFNTWAQVTLDVRGSTVQAQVYRPDTAMYLNSVGDWQADQTWALTVTDTSIAGPGKVGVGRAAQYAGTVAFDDFTITPVPAGSLPSWCGEREKGTFMFSAWSCGAAPLVGG
jgi:hypothetical protein